MKIKAAILIVDDHLESIELLEAYLVPEGYEIVKAANGEEALEILSRNKIDLILLDIIMPGLGGLEVTRRIRQDKKTHQLPIILITVLSETEDRIKGIEAGCDDFLTMPIDKMELLARVRSLLKVKAYNDLKKKYRKELESEVSKKTDELKHTLEKLQQEITERKRTEQELIKLRLGIERSSEAIFVTDIDGIIQYVNPAFELIYGYTSNEVCGQTPRILKSGRLTPSEYKQFWESLLSKKTVIAEIINKTKDGRFISVEVSTSPILDEQDSIIGFMGIHRDITLRKLSKEKETSLERQLQQAQKLESIGTLASGIAHDFNNILAIILGHSSLLQHRINNPQKFSQSIEAITNATQRGTSVVKQLLTFARKTESLFDKININGMIDEIKKLLQETFPKTIVISTSLHQDLPAIIADATQIHQVLLNLCVNARDAMPNGGSIFISSSMIEGRLINVQFSKTTARQYVKIEVTDTGIGMNEEIRRRIFEPFFTTKGLGKGTGLGMAVVFGIVEHHKGFIDVRSAPGDGTSFTMYLPIPERTLEDLQPVQKSVQEIPGGTETILIIEDEVMLLELVKASLVSKGYTVLTAEDGLRGVEIYQSYQKEIAIVLSDLGLPKLEGKDVFKKIREINPKAKVIITSGFIEPEMKSKMFKAGLIDFIQKPQLLNEVLQKIRNAIDIHE